MLLANNGAALLPTPKTCADEGNDGTANPTNDEGVALTPKAEAVLPPPPNEGAALLPKDKDVPPNDGVGSLPPPNEGKALPPNDGAPLPPQARTPCNFRTKSQFKAGWRGMHIWDCGARDEYCSSAERLLQQGRQEFERNLWGWGMGQTTSGTL